MNPGGSFSQTTPNANRFLKTSLQPVKDLRRSDTMAVTRRKKRYLRSRELKRRRQSWEASVQKHYDHLLKVARRYTNGDKARAEGLVQRVMIRVLSQCPKLIPEQAIIPYL